MIHHRLTELKHDLTSGFTHPPSGGQLASFVRVEDQVRIGEQVSQFCPGQDADGCNERCPTSNISRTRPFSRSPLISFRIAFSH